jgi:drug/metabolite transporter (DMT)-like permease
VSSRAVLFGVLIASGAGWGATQPLAKIAVSEGHRHLGLIFWQVVIASVLLGVIQTLRGKGLPLHRGAIRVYLTIALLGSVLPSITAFQAAVYLPSGINSIMLSTVPLLAFPLALAMGTDRFGWVRLLGLTCGIVGVVLIAAPEASLPDRAMLVVLPLAIIGPLFYAVEANVVAKWGTAGLDPIAVLYGASVAGIGLSLPGAVLTGSFIDPRAGFGAPEAAIAAIAVINAVVYTAYVWMVGRAGAVFAAQVSYLVTGFGLVWAMLFLGERYAPTVWAAVALMLVGVFLVQPRKPPEGVAGLAPAPAPADTPPQRGRGARPATGAE